MHILILGSGGREHALAWAVQQNPKCDRLTCAPGNAGMAALATIAQLDINDGAAVVRFVKDNSVDFVIIGPEAPLAAGVADDLRMAGIDCFGPSAAAAQLEASKAFTKAICDVCNAPTASYKTFDTLSDARDYVTAQGAPIVIKADGLAAGKGVIVAMDMETALSALDDIFSDTFGAAGASVVIEEFMQGEEASFFVLCDGKTILPIGTAQDHKRAFDGDQGPNTGGMGAYSPAPILTDALQDTILETIIRPTIAQMARRGTPFEGVLYAGVMIKDEQARLVEYNVRFGDPECQAIMMRLGAQALDAMLACAQGRLDQMHLNWAEDHAICVVYAAQGYPSDYAKGSVIDGLDGLNDGTFTQVFHAGTSQKDGQIIATGGRVLSVTARGNTLLDAHQAAYSMLDKIDWHDGFYRKDIAWRALKP